MLELDGLTAGYAGSTVLHGIDLTVAAGTVHAIVGHNGAGKTTLVHAVAGLLHPGGGTVRLDGRDLTGRPPHLIARAGIRLVPQGRRVFPRLTVAEHLRLAHRPYPGRVAHGPTAWTPRRVLESLPRLAERRSHRGADLSGGEQQMLALARALLGAPRILLLDEPTEGLAPALTRQVQELVTTLAGEGIAVLLVAPSPAVVTSCDVGKVTVLTSGRVTARFTGAQTQAAPEALHRALDLMPAREFRGPDREEP